MPPKLTLFSSKVYIRVGKRVLIFQSQGDSEFYRPPKHLCCRPCKFYSLALKDAVLKIFLSLTFSLCLILSLTLCRISRLGQDVGVTLGILNTFLMRYPVIRDVKALFVLTIRAIILVFLILRGHKDLLGAKSHQFLHIACSPSQYIL